MNYAKPEITVIGAAAAAIQNQPKGSKLGTVSDNVRHITAPAYEADE
ncbi:MAG: hypothetical protein WAK21_07265 [Candidatus Sulfotelmatobacter sp.]|jgi:hypothetical protein